MNSIIHRLRKTNSIIHRIRKTANMVNINLTYNQKLLIKTMRYYFSPMGEKNIKVDNTQGWWESEENVWKDILATSF